MPLTFVGSCLEGGGGSSGGEGSGGGHANKAMKNSKLHKILLLIYSATCLAIASINKLFYKCPLMDDLFDEI